MVSANYQDRFGKTWYLDKGLIFGQDPPIEGVDFPDKFRETYYIKEHGEKEPPTIELIPTPEITEEVK